MWIASHGTTASTTPFGGLADTGAGRAVSCDPVLAPGLAPTKTNRLACHRRGSLRVRLSGGSRSAILTGQPEGMLLRRRRLVPDGLETARRVAPWRHLRPSPASS